MRVSPPPKICFINLGAYNIFTKTSIPVGGAEVYIYELSKHLSSSYAVSVITGNYGQKQIEKREGVTIIPSCNMLKQHSAMNVLALWNAQWKSSADMYILSVFGKDLFPTWLFCKVFRKKIIYIAANDNECNSENIKKSPFWGMLFKIVLEHCDTIVTTVKSQEHLLRIHHPQIACPIIHINLGISMQETIAAPKKYILWLARCTTVKNPHLFIKLAKEFPQEHFVMVASQVMGSEALFNTIKIVAEKQKNITFIPGTAYASTQNTFNNAKIAVNTSDFEGFSVAFIQSGIAGTVIATLNSNPDNIININNIGSCADGDFKIMINQIRRLLANEKDWEEKSINIKKYTLKNHDIMTVLPVWEKLFAKILNATELN